MLSLMLDTGLNTVFWIHISTDEYRHQRQELEYLPKRQQNKKGISVSFQAQPVPQDASVRNQDHVCIGDDLMQNNIVELRHWRRESKGLEEEWITVHEHTIYRAGTNLLLLQPGNTLSNKGG